MAFNGPTRLLFNHRSILLVRNLCNVSEGHALLHSEWRM